VTQRAQLRPHAQIWEHLALPWITDLPLIASGAKQRDALPIPPGGDSDA
jgi:hypothetical protein